MDEEDQTKTNEKTGMLDTVQRCQLTVLPQQLTRKFEQIGEKYYRYFPRCEYRTRINGTSKFSMSTSRHWDSYSRSTHDPSNFDRIHSLLNGDKTTTKHKLTTIAGSVLHPFHIKEYKSIFNENKSEMECDNVNDTVPLDFYIYDDILKHKQNMCSILINEFDKKMESKKSRHIDLYYRNEYPCIIVEIAAIKNVLPHEDVNSLFNIIMAHFVAITSYTAMKVNVPIEIVIRSGFGHNIPTASILETSFRISIGFVPHVYVEKVLVPSLIELDTFVSNVLFPRKDLCIFSAEELQFINEKTTENTFERWEQTDSFIDILCKVCDSSEKPISCHITSCRKYIDLLANYVLEELQTPTPNLTNPLKKILMKFMETNNGALNVTEAEYNAPKIDFDENEDAAIQNDADFWKRVNQFDIAYKTKNIDILSKFVKEKRLIGMYAALEEANLEFIRNSSDQHSQNGYGSDSDCEVEIPYEGRRKIVFSKKVTVANGMTAIYLAQYLAVQQTGCTEFNTDSMYHETVDTIDKIQDIFQEIDLSQNEYNQKMVLTIDLNHLNVDDDGVQLELDEIVSELTNQRNAKELMIIDYTSATTDKIHAAIDAFIPHVDVILLVSSGLKNEQIGADMNPYGTLRIVASNKTILNELYSRIETILKNEELELPKQSHFVRRAYKKIGAVVTNEAIFKKNRWKYTKF